MYVTLHMQCWLALKCGPHSRWNQSLYFKAASHAKYIEELLTLIHHSMVELLLTGFRISLMTSRLPRQILLPLLEHHKLKTPFVYWKRRGPLHKVLFHQRLCTFQVFFVFIHLKSFYRCVQLILHPFNDRFYFFSHGTAIAIKHEQMLLLLLHLALTHPRIASSDLLYIFVTFEGVRMRGRKEKKDLKCSSES